MTLLNLWRTWLSLTLMFLVGLVIGCFGTLRTVQRHVNERRNSETWTPKTLAWLDREVDLTSEQAEKIRPVVQKSMDDLLNLRTDAEQQVRIIMGSMLLEASTELTDQQRERLKGAIEKLRLQRQGRGSSTALNQNRQTSVTSYAKEE